MSEFIYEKVFQKGVDTTRYRCLSNDFVSVSVRDGREITTVNPQGLELLAKTAFTDLAFFLRGSHLKKLADILDDKEASDNDKYVAYAMLRNSVVAAEGKLPWCQDTGTALVIAKKGENVFTGADDSYHLSRGIYEAYGENNLRYSQVVPYSMFEEKNSGTNLPAQIDIEAVQGGCYEFLFIAKGGGSANKTFLYQQSKSLLNETALCGFVKEKLDDLDTSACPPYHLALVVGGTSADMALKTAKMAAAGYYDDLPTTGNDSGRAFRDLEWEGKVEAICRDSGIGAQYGGKYLVHDVRVIRLPRHAASCPVSLAVSCSADRNMKARIDAGGIYIEELEKNPERYLPKKAPQLIAPVEVDLDRPLNETLSQLSNYPARTLLSLSGTIIVARDVAHARINEIIKNGGEMPDYFKKYPIYYAGPAKTPENMVSGSMGPTTADRMDDYIDLFQSLGGSLVSIAKGRRSEQVTDACKKYGGFYIGAIGGPAALMAAENIISSEIIDFDDLGMEAVRKIRVRNMPAFILIDDKGNDK